MYLTEDYQKLLKTVNNENLDWKTLDNKTIMITGVTGMIGSFIVDCINFINNQLSINIKVIGIGRSIDKFNDRFNYITNNDFLKFIALDITNLEELKKINSKIDYIFHAASNTHPLQYSNDPVGTITTNIFGTYNLLELAKNNLDCKFLLASSIEIYGENDLGKEYFEENDLGYINCNTLRSGYPESKRCSESMCSAYLKQHNVDFNILRFTRTYGPTFLNSDSKAITQFIKKGLSNEDIVLKSEGNQRYSYCFVADAAIAFFHILFNGENATAYNISSNSSDVTLKELANLIAVENNVKVIFELPDETEKAGYSTATKALACISKLNEIGFTSKYSMSEGIKITCKLRK